MGKVITVWGSPGSGKSMFSCILAKALTRDKRKAIIINAEISVPMLPVWLPDQIIQTNASVGQVLSSVEIDTSLVASHVTVLKSYPFIGLMGYSAGENTESLCKLLDCGRHTAVQIGDLAHARITMNSRVLWSVQRVKEYLYEISC